MVGNDVLRIIKPELAHLCKHGSLLGNFIIKNHIKAADSVCGNHNQAVTVIINLPYLTFFNRLHNTQFSPHLILLKAECEIIHGAPAAAAACNVYSDRDIILSVKTDITNLSLLPVLPAIK